MTIFILSSCQNKTDRTHGVIIITNVKKEINEEKQMEHFRSQTNFVPDAALLVSEFQIVDISENNDMWTHSKCLSSWATIKDNITTITCSTKSPDFTGEQFIFKCKDKTFNFENNSWSDVIEIPEKNTKITVECFPLRINKERFKKADTVFASVVIKTTTVTKTDKRVEYLKGRIQAIVQ